MKLLNLLAFIFLCFTQSVCPDTTVAAVVAKDQAIASADNQKNTLSCAATANDNKTPVTHAIVDLGIPLNPGPNNPAPGLTMQLYTKVDGHITIETEITLEEDELPHPLVAKMLAIIGYEPLDCGYFWCTEPRASKSDLDTTIVSIKRPYRRSRPQEVHIKLHTLLDTEAIHTYIAILKARRDGKQTVAIPQSQSK